MPFRRRLTAVFAAVALLLAAAALLGVRPQVTGPRDVVLTATSRGLTVSWLSSTRDGQVVQVGDSTFPASTQPTQAGLWSHAAAIDAPSGTVAYRVGGPDTWSDWFQVTAPVDADPGEDWSFGFFADPQLGTRDLDADGETWGRATSAAHADGAQLMVTSGDLVQWGLPREHHAVTANPALATTPWIVAPGNHDQRNRALFDQLYPTDPVVDWGNVRFIVLDTNADSWPRDIQSGDGWTVAILHHSPFAMGTHQSDADVGRVRDELVPQLTDAGVDLVLSGHDHVYTRSGPVDGTVFVAGNSATGSKFYDVVPDGPAAPWAEVIDQDYTPDYTVVRVSDDELWVETRNVDDRQVVDAFRISR